MGTPGDSDALQMAMRLGFVIFSVLVGMAVGADQLTVAVVGTTVASLAACIVRPRNSSSQIECVGKAGQFPGLGNFIYAAGREASGIWVGLVFT